MKTINDQVTVKSKNAEGKEVDSVAPVSYAEFETKDDVLGYLASSDDAKFKEFLRDVNYGVNLRARSTVRAALLRSLEGPDKSINKVVETLVKSMAALGMPMTEDEARAQVLKNIEDRKAQIAAANPA